MKVERERPLVERGWRYTLVGLLCAITNYGIVLGVDAFGGHYLLGVFLGFLVVTPMGYALHCLFTFDEPVSMRAFLRFTATVITSYPIAVGLLAILCSGLNLNVAWAYPIAVVGMFAWNFAAAHWAILPSFELSPKLGSREPQQ